MPYDQSPGSPYNQGGQASSSADYFSDSPAGGAEQKPPEGEGQEKETSGGETAVLPKSILGGKEFKPGEEVVLKVVRIHGDSVEVAYAEEKGPGQEEMAQAPPPGGGGPGGGMGASEMAGLMG